MCNPRSSLAELVDPGWASALAPFAANIREIGQFLRGESTAGRACLPSAKDSLRAFMRPFDGVRLLIVGQDPYPTPGHPMGLAFSVQPDVHPLPASLNNIYRELMDDVGVPRPPNGDLRPWADRGVLLLNRVLTVQSGRPKSHYGCGWEAVTEAAVKALVARGRPLVAVLWGTEACSLKHLLVHVPYVESVHPSPWSACRGFFGSKPFSRANRLLTAQGASPINWALP